MRILRVLFHLLASVMLVTACLAQSPAPAASGTKDLDEIVVRFRKIIVLTDNQAALNPIVRDQVTVIGRVLFERNQEALATLETALSAELTEPNSPEIDAFLARVETATEYRDADKLVFRDLIEDLATDAPAGSKVQKRLAEDLAALNSIQALYEKEIGKALGQFQTRAMPVHREAWDRYLAFLKEKYQQEQILKEYETVLPPAESRGGTKKNSGELFGTELPSKTLLLTFDDGPHPRYTAQILEVLKRYKVSAVFFEVGHNLGTVDKNGMVKLTPGAAISYRIVESGSALGNHSFSHPVLSKLDQPGYTQEIDETSKLLAYIMKAEPTVFRPPYGATNDAILSLTQAKHLKSMIWNIDSLDWSDPVPASIEQRVLQEVQQAGHGIILFHDIHKRALEILPDLIEKLQAQGYKFASWKDSGVNTGETRGLQMAETPAAAANPYRESWAAVIGIDDYERWPKLRYAANDAQAVRDALIQKYKFKPENVFVLLNQDATRQSILSLLGDKLANPDMVKRDDRVFVFFAGHGATRKLPSGRDLGYIIPVDADLNNYQGQAISMTNFQDVAESIPAKHLFLVMDSCYSGLALTRGGTITASRNYLQEIARREARQMFTAGGADQQVADNGPNGHSVFTWTLLQGLDGRADLNGDGVITASELAAYVVPAVSALSQQTPSFGNLAGSEGGDFIFDLRHESEFLNSDSAQLGDDAIRVNAELARLRAQNEKLQQELAAANTRLKQTSNVTRSGVPPSTAAALNDEGMRLYKEKNYAGAVLKFTEAAKLEPTSALFANNAGFALYKLQQYEDSVRWYQQAIKLDPQRAVAYVNLADADMQLQRNQEAKENYQKYLQLAPNSKSVPYVQQQLDALEKLN